MVSTEGPVNVETDKLSLQVEKVTLQDLGRKKNIVKNSEFKAPSPGALGLEESKRIYSKAEKKLSTKVLIY